MLWRTMKNLEQGGGAQSPRKSPEELPERFKNLSLIDSISYLLLATELDKDVVQSYLATLATPNQLIQLTMCCSQPQLETAARPASKAAARRVWTTADKGNKARLDATTATSSASASASATGEATATEAKATDAKRSWADEPVDPRYIGQDIDLATLTEDQIPELRRRAAVAKEEHERLMQEKRERLAAHQEQATLEAEIALEELRLQRLRQRDEAERLQGPFARPARDTSQRRRDAEAARRVAEARWIEAKRRGWASLQLGAGGRDRPVSQLRVVARPRIRTETLRPPWVGRYILLATTMIQLIGPRGPTLKDLAKARATRAAGGPS